MKRKIKKQLKGDEFVSGFNKFLHLVKTWEREIIIATGAGLAVVLLFLGFQFLKSQQVKKDSRAVGEILTLRADLAKNPQNLTKLEQFAAKGGKFGRIASVNLATHWVGQGQLDKAQSALAGIKDGSKDFFYYQAQDLYAQVCVLKGDYDTAIGLLKKIEDEKPKEYLLDAVFFHHAEALEKKGVIPEALALYKKLQEEYAQTYYGYDASLKVKKLETAK